MRFTWNQSNFNAGVWSPQLYGRIDLPKRKNAMQACVNYVPLLQGPLTRRPGTYYISNAAGNDAATRLQRFEFSTTQAYVLEFTAGLIRFYTNGGQLQNSGSPYQVATTYLASELQTLNFTQSADVLYIVHPNHPPATLSRLGATNWVLADFALVDGPYLPRNVSQNGITATSTTVGANATLTATTTASINNGAGFVAADVGRFVRLFNQTVTPVPSTLWSVYKITAIISTVSVSAVVIGLTPV